MRRRPALGAAVLAALTAALAGCPSARVTRVVDGLEIEGRFVSPRAYAAYAEGAEAEARGRLAEALEAFARAVRHDPDSVELWTRLGAVRCQLGQRDQARKAFSNAEDLDPDFEPLWRARAQCAEAQGRDAAALGWAARAAALDPERDETTLFYARLLEQGGREIEAARWHRGLVVRRPHSVQAWRALEAFAARAGDAAWQSYAARELRGLSESRRLVALEPDGARPPAEQARRRVDRALATGDLKAARQIARSAHLDPRLLAARAIAVGQAELAREQAELLLAADPADADARIAMALAADLLGEAERAAELMRELPADAFPASHVGRLLMGELLERHVGPEAAQRWLASCSPPRAAEPLPADLERRLRERVPKGSVGASR